MTCFYDTSGSFPWDVSFLGFLLLRKFSSSSFWDSSSSSFTSFCRILEFLPGFFPEYRLEFHQELFLEFGNLFNYFWKCSFFDSSRAPFKVPCGISSGFSYENAVIVWSGIPPGILSGIPSKFLTLLEFHPRPDILLSMDNNEPRTGRLKKEILCPF